MAAPKFDWQGSTEGPEGVAKFSSGAYSVEILFKTFEEAHDLFILTSAAHLEGVSDGQRAMRRYVETALVDSQEKWW